MSFTTFLPKNTEFLNPMDYITEVVNAAYVEQTCFNAPLALLCGPPTDSGAHEPFDSINGTTIPPIEARCMLSTPAFLEHFTEADSAAWAKLATQDGLTSALFGTSPELVI